MVRIWSESRFCWSDGERKRCQVVAGTHRMRLEETHQRLGTFHSVTIARKERGIEVRTSLDMPVNRGQAELGCKQD